MLTAHTSGPRDATLHVLLCHGFGADPYDLAPLASELDLGVPARFHFPAAPYAFPPGWGGLAWFPSTAADIAAFATGDHFANLAPIDPPGLAESGALLAEYAEGITCEDGQRRLVLGGFSQGAIVACEAVLAHGVRPDAMLLLSGALIAERRWRADAERAGPEGMRIVQTHGTADPVLPVESGRALASLLADAGANLTLLEFDGGHTIPGSLLGRIAGLLAR